jgi:hypothetical protein
VLLLKAGILCLIKLGEVVVDEAAEKEEVLREKDDALVRLGW